MKGEAPGLSSMFTYFKKFSTSYAHCIVLIALASTFDIRKAHCVEESCSGTYH